MSYPGIRWAEGLHELRSLARMSSVQRNRCREVKLPKSLRDPVKVMERGRFLLALKEAGCHRLGESQGCWRIRCNLGGECYLAEKARRALTVT